MSGFSADWLSLREPIDHAARNRDVLTKVKDLLAEQDTPTITDLAAGTGSTVSALDAFIEKPVTWQLVDYDEDLLQMAAKRPVSGTVKVSRVDMAQSLSGTIEGNPDLVTTSAFLDLVSEEWLKGLVDLLAAEGLPFYAALTYDGRAGVMPPLAEDQNVISLFNRHQLTDKGFGDALGPKAAETAVRLFQQAGFEVFSGRSDWEADKDQKAFQKALLYGWQDAASDIDHRHTADFVVWLGERLALIDEGAGRLFVGHVDFLAIPKERPKNGAS
ncbi:MAG: class I SAM-dependent methyltransferase [Pseudomonadota bacterium]